MATVTHDFDQSEARCAQRPCLHPLSTLATKKAVCLQIGETMKTNELDWH